MVLGPGGGGTGCWSPDGPALGEGGYSFGGGVRVTSKLLLLDGLGLGECGGVLGVGVGVGLGECGGVLGGGVLGGGVLGGGVLGVGIGVVSQIGLLVTIARPQKK